MAYRQPVLRAILVQLLPEPVDHIDQEYRPRQQQPSLQWYKKTGTVLAWAIVAVPEAVDAVEVVGDGEADRPDGDSSSLQ